MFRNYLDKIERDEDVRKNLIELRKLLKTEPGSAAWQRDRQRCLSLMLKLLKHEDAKVRKNAALILGEMGCQDALDALFYAYECEEKLFVKKCLSDSHESVGLQDVFKTLSGSDGRTDADGDDAGESEASE